MCIVKTILHPTDFSHEAGFAFSVACSMAKDYGARLVLLHVMRPSVAPVMHRQTTPNPLEAAEGQDALRGTFPWPRPTDPNLRVEHRVAEGDAAEEILRLAQAIHADLIVMGTHGRSGLNRLLTGSVAEEVVRQAGCPVMTIRNPPSKVVTPPAHVKLLAHAGEVVDVRPLGAALRSSETEKLVGSHGIEVVRLVLPAGKEVYHYKTGGTLIVHCLEGKVAVTALGRTHKLEAGQFMYLPKDEPHTLVGVDDTSLLLTTVVPAS